MRFQIIANPACAQGAGASIIPQVVSCLSSSGVEYQLEQTERPWHAAELARHAALDGFDVVVAAGGDGTVNEVINGLMQARAQGHGDTRMGLIPIGRGNDFAYGAGIPQDLPSACRVLTEGFSRRIDVGYVVGGLYPQGRYFGNGVGVGFDAVVGFEAAKLKQLTGFVAYFVAAMRTIFLFHQGPTLQLELGGENLSGQMLMVSVMNGRRMGGGFMMAPDGLIEDGMFDVCIAHQVNRARILQLIAHFIKGTQGSQPEIHFARTPLLHIKAVKGSIPAHADGETLCTEGQELRLEILPAALEMICQRQEAP